MACFSWSQMLVLILFFESMLVAISNWDSQIIQFEFQWNRSILQFRSPGYLLPTEYLGYIMF